MAKKYTLERYLDALLNGDRTASRKVIEETLQTGMPVNTAYMNIIWPVMVEIEKLLKKGIINPAQEAMATRINRTIVDQLQNKLPRKPEKAKKVAICSISSDIAELGGQMIADLFESDGWQTRFVGGGVNNDDLLGFVNDFGPDVLVIYGMDAKGAPATRQLIDTIKGVNAYPDMKIMLSGGIFGRAEGLWEEIGADLYADTAAEAVRLAGADEGLLPEPKREIKRRKRTVKAEVTAN